MTPPFLRDNLGLKTPKEPSSYGYLCMLIKQKIKKLSTIYKAQKNKPMEQNKYISKTQASVHEYLICDKMQKKKKKTIDCSRENIRRTSLVAQG